MAPVSWVAHDVEPYVIQAHLGKRVSFLALLIGSWSPDLFTKWMVYGATAGINVDVGDPSNFHRSWPGVGPLHSPLFGIVLALAVYGLTRNQQWAWGLLIGQWAHCFSDTLDTKGTMLFFPLTEWRVSFDAWAYAAGSGRDLDTAAYFSCLGFAWDGAWLVLTFVFRRALYERYFRETVMPADPVWGWLGRYLPYPALLVLYRAALFYGASRWIGWIIWAHVLHTNEFDFSWGGPGWIPASE